MFSDEDFEKPAKFDMKLFDPVKSEYPCLSFYEDKVFEQLKTHYSLFGKLVANSRDLYASSFVINGVLVRSLNNYRGTLWALGSGNPHVWYDCLRSQCETLALLHYLTLNPDYIKAATVGERNHPEQDRKITNIITMVDKLDKIHNGIRKDYDDLCNLVHPNPASLYASIVTLDEQERVVALTSRLLKISDDKVILYFKILYYWTHWIFDEVNKLADIFKK